MENKIPLLDRLKAHIEKVEQDATVPLDVSLFEECQIFLVPQLLNDPANLLDLVSRIARMLPALQQDPQPVIQLLAKLITPFSFSDILSLNPSVDFVAGLDVTAQFFNPLVLDLLAKASSSSRDAAIVAGMPNVVYALVRLWLTTPDMGIAEKSATVLLELLAVDKEQSGVAVHGIGGAAGRPGGQGLVWRRVFADKDVYGLLYSLCSLKGPGDQALGKKEKTVAQARLLATMPKIGVLDWEYIIRSHHPDIESAYGLQPEKEGLLDYVCMHLVDTKDDVLMHMSLLQFYADLISTNRHVAIENPNLSTSLHFLQTRGLHALATSFWLHPTSPQHDPIDLTFLSGPSAAYITAYTTNYPSAFLASPDFHHVLARLTSAFSISPNQWAHGQAPAHALDVLTAIPPIALLPRRDPGTTNLSTPLTMVPYKTTTPAALYALAKIFHGPPTPALTFPTPSDSHTTEPSPSEQTSTASAAFAAYKIYHHHHPTLFATLVSHAETTALPSHALSAIHLLSALASSTHHPLPPTNAYDTTTPPPTIAALPNPQTLSTLLHTPYPTSPPQPLAGLLASPARESILPWLLRPPQTFANLVGGRGDPESAAYRIAMAKWDLLVLVHGRARALVARGEGGAEGLGGMVELLQMRITEGVWGVREDVGGRIATMDL